jgi:hypothetical protein
MAADDILIEFSGNQRVMAPTFAIAKGLQVCARRISTGARRATPLD